SWAKTFVSKTVLPTLSRLASGLGHALSSLGPSALGAITSITSASVFSGGLLASLTAGVMLTSTTTLTNLNGAFQTNVSGSFSTAPHGTGAPNVGCYQFVSDPAQLKAFANQTGTSTKAFTPAEEQMVAVAGGIQFSYPTLTGKLCGPDMTSRPVKLIRASGRTWGGWTISADAVILYDEGILNQDDLDYTLWHEAGHIMDARNSGLLQSYAASYSGGRFETYPLYILPGICSPFVPLSEAFAETITVYLMNIHHPNWPYPCAGGVYNLQTRRPHEYSWVQQNIYH
ncbi:MAG TPA: hypothetical protein VFG51_02200, partial [Candidatus Saccharimonadia bacterium]|nr:hypothetical protein [Candidatus Saccharimonadia bacterium]